MRITQVFFAFLVALAVMSVIFMGIWHYSMGRVVNKLPDILQQAIPGKVKYVSVDTLFHPFKGTVFLKEVSVSMLDSKTGSTVVAELGDISIVTQPFEMKKIEIYIPEDVNIITSHQGLSHEYRLAFIDPLFELTQRNGVFDVAFSVSGFVVKGRQGGYFSNLVKAGYSYINRIQSDNQWMLISNNLDLKGLKAFQKWPVLTALSLSWEPQGMQDYSSGYILSAMGAKNKVVFDTMLLDYLRHVSVFSQMNIIEGRLVLDDMWYSYQGSLALDKNLNLDMQGSLSSNKFAELITGIKQMTGDFPYALERMLLRLGADQNKTQGITVMSRRGMLNINGAPVGQIQELPELVHLHGRGLGKHE